MQNELFVISTICLNIGVQAVNNNNVFEDGNDKVITNSKWVRFCFTLF